MNPPSLLAAVTAISVVRSRRRRGAAAGVCTEREGQKRREQVLRSNTRTLASTRVRRKAVAAPPLAGSHGAGRMFRRLPGGSGIGAADRKAHRFVGHPPYAVR